MFQVGPPDTVIGVQTCTQFIFEEMQTREDFYRSTGVRASSSCSDDSVIDKERDNLKDQEAWVTSNVGDKTEFFSPEDMISLSLEYYQAHLDTSSLEDNKDSVEPVNRRDNQDSEVVINSETDQVKTNGCDISVESKVNAENDSEIEKNSERSSDKVNSDEQHKENKNDVGKRYLKCPAAVSMQLLQKFLRMKFGLTVDHRVDIIYKGEVLPNYFTLIDVAYTFKWSRTKPMRFFYRIFTPMKIKPIKIINTTSTSGSKQLQIVQVDETTKLENPKITENPPEEKVEKPLTPKPETPKELIEDTEDRSSYKEKLMAHLQLQSTKKIQPKVNEKDKEIEKEPTCVYEYVEPDKEEIKRFAEKRDREWALQKKLDEKNEHSDHHISKKRKKSKHSKNESVHKKRKLHAEITSNEEEDLKLKVKITPHNSHKHKHHKNSQNHELSNKEKLLQMRQVRHKHVNSEDKTVQTISTSNVTSSKQSVADKINEKLKLNKERENEKKKDVDNKVVRFSETDTTSNNVNQVEEKDPVINAPSVPAASPKEVNKPSVAVANKDTKTVVKEWGINNKPTLSVKQEKLEGEKQKTFLKSFQSYTEKYNIEKIKQTKMEARQKINNSLPITRPLTPLEKKINSIQQQCTIEPKKIKTPPPHITKTDSAVDSVPKVLNSYPPGFTVSKIEAGFKRKAENDGQMVDKRPSLEITLIPHTSKSQMIINRNYDRSAPKRPPPSTIPLDRIRKSNAKSGISIIPKTPQVCDNIGALDLSNKTSPENSPKPTNSISKAVNGLNIALTSRNLSNIGTDKPTHQLSNLQMLSKVASEHPILNKMPQQSQNVVKTQRPTMPNLQNLAAAGLQTSLPSVVTPNCSKPNLPKLQKLTEMAKTQFKISGNAQIRSPRPNQNQNIRNIPNPSLLVRQQNQNRLNSLSANVEKESLSVVPNSVNTKVNNIVEKKEIPV
ncbi:hypothetical protein WA026_016658 [Henosepilachna vigintioctopunctata]|uniref:RAWUL domain-containing protein n=1 Tax=Henosepilachna vigintioctopunctata TaxID=420089 RepID=A0AAW1UZR8_9CUCU